MMLASAVQSGLKPRRCGSALRIEHDRRRNGECHIFVRTMLSKSKLQPASAFKDWLGGRCHVVGGLVAKEHDENQLLRISVPSGDHSPGDLALSPVHPQLSRRRTCSRGAELQFRTKQSDAG